MAKATVDICDAIECDVVEESGSGRSGKARVDNLALLYAST